MMPSPELSGVVSNLRDIVFRPKTTEATRQSTLNKLADPTGGFAKICAANQLAGDTEILAMLIETRLAQSTDPQLARTAEASQFRNAALAVNEAHCIPLAQEALMIFNTTITRDEKSAETVCEKSEPIAVDSYFGTGSKLVIEKRGDTITFSIYYPNRDPRLCDDAITHKDFTVDGVVMSNRIRAGTETIPGHNFILFTHSNNTAPGANPYTQINPKYVGTPNVVPGEQTKLDHMVALMFAHKLHQALMDLTTPTKRI